MECNYKKSAGWNNYTEKKKNLEKYIYFIKNIIKLKIELYIIESIWKYINF